MIQCESCDLNVAEDLRKREERDKTERIFYQLRASGLPIDYRTGSRKTSDLPPIAGHAATLCRVLGSDLRGLYLHGPAGSFKTSVAASWLADTIQNDLTGRYVSMFDLISDIHSSYRYGDEESRVESRSVLVDRCVNTPRLVLDDLGKEKASEHAAGVIFEILDGRYRRWKPGDWMIVTSNFGLETLCDRFPGDDLADPIRRRLAEMTIAVEMERDK